LTALPDATDETRAFLARLGAEPFAGSSDLLAKHTVAEIDKWGRIIKAAKVEPQ
jgi:hypothetical protein